IGLTPLRQHLLARGVFLFRQVVTACLLGWPLERGEVQVIDRPGPAQVRLSPGGQGGTIIPRHRGYGRQVEVLRCHRGGGEGAPRKHGQQCRHACEKRPTQTLHQWLPPASAARSASLAWSSWPARSAVM